MKMNGLARSGFCVALTATLSGCSWLFVDGPPRVRPGQAMPAYAQCTESMALPNLDIAGAVVSAIGAAASVALITELDGDEEGPYIVGAAANAAWTVIYGAAASSGKKKVRACRQFLATPVAPPTYLAADSVRWLSHDWKGTEQLLVPKRH